MVNDPTYLGTVQDVSGVTIRVFLHSNTLSGVSFVDGQAYRIGQVGSFVRIPMGYIDLFGIVSQIGASAVPESMVEENPYGNRWMAIELVGEGSKRGLFSRGVSQYPTIGDSVFLVTEEGLANIYGRPDEPKYIRIGSLASSEAIPALVDINKIVTRHCAVVGSTGSGKSTTVAGLMSSLTKEGLFPSARILVLDLHGEYATASEGYASVFRINPNQDKGEKPFYLPYWAMTYDELLPIILGNPNDADRAQVLQKITDMKRNGLNINPRDGVNEDNVSVDSPVPFSIHQFWFDLHCAINSTHTIPPSGSQSIDSWALELDEKENPVQSGDALRVIPPKFRGVKNVKEDPDKVYLSNSTLQLRRPLEALASKLRDPRFDFLFRPGPWQPNLDGQPLEDLDTLLEGWLGGKKTISILDLSGIPPTILTDLINALLRIIYDALFWARDLAEGGRERPLMIVMEEAHLYLSPREEGGASAAVKRIVKEGRKYGIGAMIVSQRPSEIDSTILAQCGTIFALRLSNSTDRNQVTSTAADNLAGVLGMLPILRTGEAIVVGEAVNLPTRALIDSPPPSRRPSSSDPIVYDHDYPGGWNNKVYDKSDYSEVVHVWRKQQPRSPSSLTKGEQRMERTYVESSNIASIGYETDTLEIEFLNGGVYQYFDVPQHVYDGIMTADSKGKYFHANIKGVYRYAKL